MDLNDYAKQSRQDNDKWWRDPSSGVYIPRNKGLLIALMHSELSECLEGIRKNKMDEHLPHRHSEEVELADLLIRVFDYSGEYKLDIEGAYQDKRAFNAVREDHTFEARNKPDGKKW